MANLTPLAASMTSALFAAIWQGLLLAAVVALCLRLIPALTAAARSLIWLTVAALAVLLPFTQAPAPSALLRPALHGTLNLYIDARWTLLIAAVWAVASLVRAVQLATGAIALRRLSRKASPIAAPEICATLLAESRRAESEPVQLCTSAEVDRPSVLGFFHPRILLPAGLVETLSPAELQQVLLHELEHLRRRDDWTNLLGRLALVVFPLNPVLLWLERRLATERELACDDRVLQATGARKAYATCLAHLAEHTLIRRGVSLALALVGVYPARTSRPGAAHSELGRRVARILSLPTRTLSQRTSTALVAGLIALTTGGSVELAHSPQLLSFAAPTSQLAASVSLQTTDGLLPVVYHSRRDASPFLMTTAVLTPGRATTLNTRVALRKHVRTHVCTTLRRSSVPLTPSVRLTSFHVQPSDAQPHLALTLATTNQFSYTAVPVSGGWILVLLPVQAAQPTLTLAL